MKRLVMFVLTLLLSSMLIQPLWAQTPAPVSQDRFAAGGLGYFSQAKPQFQGWAALGLPLTADGKALSYTDYDVSVVPVGGKGQLSVAGYQLRFSLKTGIAYRIFQTQDGNWALYGLAAPGFTADGTSFQGAFQYGGFLSRKLKKGWGLMLGLTNETYGTTSDLAPRFGAVRKF